jgi:hypothetical protein
MGTKAECGDRMEVTSQMPGKRDRNALCPLTLNKQKKKKKKT